jgi:hypothetical protein
VNRFTATPDPVSAGGTLRICFSNPALANTTVVISLDGGPGGQSASVQIPLNGEGYGCVDWPVPATGWSVVNMNHPTSDEYTVQVV